VYVKGSAFLARKNQIFKLRGEPAWNRFIDELAKKLPFFKQPVLTATNIPVDAFLVFQQAMVDEFFDGEDRAYWEIGASAAQWALTEGPYRACSSSRDIRSFVLNFPALWRAYFTTSDCDVTYAAGPPATVTVQAHGLPRWHPYFEYLVMGYFKKSLEMLGAHRVDVRQIAGGPGVKDFCYEFTIR
jgi:hypothetical protein